MTKDHAVRFGEKTPKRILDIGAKVGAMGEANGEAADGEERLFGKAVAHLAIAHVAAHRMNGFALKGFQYRKRCQVSSMDDDLAGAKTVLYSLGEKVVRAVKVGV